jgi:hypothetical protein
MVVTETKWKVGTKYLVVSLSFGIHKKWSMTCKMSAHFKLGTHYGPPLKRLTGKTKSDSGNTKTFDLRK